MNNPVTVMDWLPTSSTSLLDAALAYASHGLRVHAVYGLRVTGTAPECACHARSRCGTPGKHPVAKGWTKTSTTDVDLVRDARRPPHVDANIGMAMGGEERVICVDVDGSLGRESLARLEAEYGQLPETLTSRSGRTDGGSHLLFIVPLRLDVKRIKNRAGILPGIDTRGENGQIVVAPSVHASGARYEWVRRVPIAELPEWLYAVLASPESSGRMQAAAPCAIIQLATSSGYIDAVLRNACRDISACAEGGRNQLLFSKAATVFEYFIGANLDTAGAHTALADAGRSCGLPSSEVASVLRNALNAARDSPRNVPPPSSRPRVTLDGEIIEDGASSGGPVSGPSVAWENDLLRTAKGEYKNTFGNICKILRHADQFRGRLRYNSMTLSPELDGKPMGDHDTGGIRELIENNWHFGPADGDTAKAVICVAKEDSYHPVQAYLNGLTWDGEERISRVAAEILSLGDATALTNTMLRKWFISVAARALSPGCKADNALVLLGPQSAGKTTFFEVLASKAWFSNSKMDIRDKDSVLQLHAAWIYEWGEIEQITSTRQAAEVKSFMTINTDTVRPPYDRSITKAARSGVIVGSTNKAQFLDDPSGSRRFYVVQVDAPIALEALCAWRDQLWAEAVSYYRKGETWWLDREQDAEREASAGSYSVEDSWESIVSSGARCMKEDDRTTYNILLTLIGLDASKQSPGEIHRLAKIMTRLGYSNIRVRSEDGTRHRVWHK